MFCREEETEDKEDTKENFHYRGNESTEFFTAAQRIQRVQRAQRIHPLERFQRRQPRSNELGKGATPRGSGQDIGEGVSEIGKAESETCLQGFLRDYSLAIEEKRSFVGRQHP